MIDFADIKPSVLNFFIFCLYLVIASTFLKFLVVAVPQVPDGFRNLVLAM